MSNDLTDSLVTTSTISRFIVWAFPVPDDDLAERRGKFVEGLKFRAVVSLAFGTLFLLLSALMPGPQPPMYQLTATMAVFAAVNLGYWILGVQSQFVLRQFYFHWFVDLLLISDVLFLLGGIDVPYALLAYLTIVVTSATFLSKRASLIVAIGATVATLILAGLQFQDIVQPPRAWAADSTTATRFIAVTAAIVFYYVFAYLAGTLADQLKAMNLNLKSARSEIEKHNRLLEEKVLLRTQELQDRNSEIEEFVHIVTHDLKNVSIGAIETARLLLANVSDTFSERTERYLRNLLEDTTRMNEMLVQLLRLFRIDQHAFANGIVDLQKVTADLVRGLNQRLERNNTQVLLGNLPEIIVDETQLRHVLGNLLDNAIKYTGEKQGATIFIDCKAQANEWIVSVQDQGIGIAANQQERIFQLYFRGSNIRAAGAEGQGEGVGLAISKRIVERWGGRLWVESQLDVGSCFSFSVPRRRRDEAELG